ncbi:MAG: HIRAN domain-containing protein [Promethearchaeota archaeon]
MSFMEAEAHHTYHTKLHDFVALQKPGKLLCYQELTILHTQLNKESALALPPIKPMMASQIYDSQIVGIYYAGSGDLLASLPEFTELTLEPDPQNVADPNAVKVMYQGTHLGYLPRVANKAIFTALTSQKNVVCMLEHYIPGVERHWNFSPERAAMTIHIIHAARFQQIFTNLMDIYTLTAPNLPPLWVEAMAALGDVVIPRLINYLSSHPEISEGASSQNFGFIIEEIIVELSRGSYTHINARERTNRGLVFYDLV